MSDVDKIKDRVMALMAKACDPAASEAEATAAMRKAEKLMAEYGLSAAECEKAEGDDFITQEWEGRQHRKHGVVFHPVDRLCCSTIAKFCGVRFFYNAPRGKQTHAEFFGLEVDVTLAHWIRATLVDQFDKAWETYLYADGRKPKSKIAALRKSFALGFADAINGRFEDWLYRETKHASDNALVFRKQDLITDELKRRGIVLQQSQAPRGKLALDEGAAGAGNMAGMAAKVSQDVGYGPRQLLIK